MMESKAEGVRKEGSPGRGWRFVVVGGAFAVRRCTLHAWLTRAAFYTAGKHSRSSPYDQATDESSIATHSGSNSALMAFGEVKPVWTTLSQIAISFRPREISD